MKVASENTEVSGKSILGLILHVKDNGGKELLDKIINSLEEDIKQVFSEKIITIDWYPYPLYINFLDAIKRELGKGDPKYCMNIGKISAKRDMGLIFHIYKIIYNPEKIIRSCGLFWKSYYRNAGEINAISWDPDKTVIRITGFPHMHPNHCQLVSGYMIGLIEEVGIKTLQENESKCTSRGDPYHEFVYQLEKK